jgi:hypothetical protein
MRSFFILNPLLVEGRRIADRKTQLPPFPAMKSALTNPCGASTKPARRIHRGIRRAEDAYETGR